MLRTWRAGDRKGQPKIPLAVLLDRGLAEIGAGRLGPCDFFTDAGLPRGIRLTRRVPS